MNHMKKVADMFDVEIGEESKIEGDMYSRFI